MKQVIVISGGSSGLGRVIAEQLSGSNSVIILSPTKEKLAGVAGEIGCDYRVCDIANNDQVTEVVNSIIDDYSRIDCLINCSGLYTIGPIEENSAEDIQKTVNINVTGTLLLTRAVIPTMKNNKRGTIITIIDQGGLYGRSNQVVHRTTKFAQSGMVKSMQSELSPSGIRVMGIYPGKIATTEQMGTDAYFDDAIDNKEVAKLVGYILSTDTSVVFPEVGIKHIDN